MPAFDSDVQSFGFRVWRNHPRPMHRDHVHTDIEVNYLVSGSMRYFLSGRFVDLPPRRLALLWGGTPHRSVNADRATEMIWVTIPMAWFLEWDLDARFIERLLRGELLLDDEEQTSFDESFMSRWAIDMKTPTIETHRIVLLEVEARMRRFARAHRATSKPPIAPIGSHVEKIASYVGNHFKDELSIAQIADAVSLHPNYAMQLFKRGCGMSLWEYITRLRVSHAQRLLISTDWKVQRIATDSGFGAPSRFYEAFTRLSGKTPREYRTAMRS